VLIKDRVSCALLQQALSCVLTHTRFMGSRKPSSSMVVELDNTLPRFMDDIGIVFRTPTDYPSRFSRGRLALGRGRT
jgi:hypothetical protein